MTEGSAPVVILGAAGQDGPFLAELHRGRGDRVMCLSRTANERGERLDVSDRDAVVALIRDARPKIVYQLAATSSTKPEAVWANHDAIATGTLNVLDAAYAHSRETRVVAIGSALQFQNDGQPIDEGTPFAATSAYAVARIHAAYAARFYRSRGLRAYVGYLFHHESPARQSAHVSARICRDVAAIARGEAEVLEVGDLSVEKEWGYAGDVAAGLATLAAQEETFEAVVGTGLAYSIGDWIDRCFAHVSLSPAGRTRQVAGFKSEYRRVVSRPAALRALGWSPRVGFDALATLMMESALGAEAQRGEPCSPP